MDILLEENRSEFLNSSLFYEDTIYDEDNTYQTDDEVIWLQDGHKYKSKIDDNTNPLSDTNSWDDLGEITKLYIYDYWQDGKEYAEKDLVQHEGHGYKSLKNYNVQPLTNTDYWEDLGEGAYLYNIWDSATTYQTDDVVIYKKLDGLYYIFRSLVDDNTSEPTTDLNWYELTTQNTYRVLDNYLNTMSSSKGGVDDMMSFYYRTTRVNYFSGMNILAERIRIRTYGDGGDKVDDITIDLVSGVEGWEDYFYGDLDEFLTNVFKNLVYLYTGYLRVDITGGQTPTLIGKLLIGYKKTLGATLVGARGGITDYSYRETDDYGNTYLKQGAFAVEVSGKIYIDNENLDSVFRRLTSLRATPTLWLSGTEDKYTTLNVYGYYKDFDIIFDNNVMSTCSLTIQGII